MRNSFLKVWAFSQDPHQRRDQRLTDIALGPLDAGEAADLAAHIAGAQGRTSNGEQLIRQAEGNPLFIIELLRWHAAAGGRARTILVHGEEGAMQAFSQLLDVPVSMPEPGSELTL